MVLDKKCLGHLIKEARKLKSEKIKSKYTGQNLADDLKISRSYLGDIESGRIYPKYELLTRIAESCEVPLSFFSENNVSKCNKENEKVNTKEKINNLIKDNGIETIAAHFEGEEFSEDDLEDIENFIKYVVQKRKNRN
ncbi:helix-turn-helix domain-containing protein [Clostridium hydrogeniformans]|uniref:helix-turn-helix domain-containing protein n=1 Tax=Clostridium hydrogeniformans TaxID=349933 RepID=UPI000690D836|nr:helix-turn-helix transcriptional regulator [Clostridium hydrogeniformans]